tara:strand:- start:295 stop:522 length:228 start_codon:yes stop_codon:yes gene_type:complete
MQNNIKEDLHFFNELVNDLINDELENPIANAITTSELISEFDLELKSSPAIPEDFKNELKKLVLNTPKIIFKIVF